MLIDVTKDRCNQFNEITSWHHFDEVGMEYLEETKAKFVIEVMTHLPRQKVWDAFANHPENWKHWFPKVECVSYSGAMPPGVGTIRRSVVDGIFYDETLLVWEEPQRWGYRINKSTAAIARAQIEITEFESIISGTKVRWILACDPLRDINQKGFNTFLESLLRQALGNLENFMQGEIHEPR